MPKIKSHHNKTIDTEICDGADYLRRCIEINSPVTDINSVRDKIVIGNTFEVCGFLPRESVDLIIADPPYNLTKSYNDNKFRKLNRSEYEQYTRKWLMLIYPLLKPSGSIYVCCDWETSLVVGNVLSELFTVRNRITWQREKGRGAKSNWKNSMEDIWFATKGDSYTFNLEAVKLRKRVIAPYRKDGEPKDWTDSTDGKYRDTCPSNFWDDITVPFWSMPENTAHPTQKPEKLIAKIILASSDTDDLVFDPFSGSGTVCVTAKKTGRHFIGTEREERFCIWAEQRLEMADTDKSIQGYSDGVFWERNTLSEQKKAKK